jgi:hypothetical protein
MYVLSTEGTMVESLSQRVVESVWHPETGCHCEPQGSKAVQCEYNQVIIFETWNKQGLGHVKLHTSSDSGYRNMQDVQLCVLLVHKTQGFFLYERCSSPPYKEMCRPRWSSG